MAQRDRAGVPEFGAMEWTRSVTGLPMAFVGLDRETWDFSHLLNLPVRVDGSSFTCRGVDRFMHAPPWRKGEAVCLLLEPMTA